MYSNNTDLLWEVMVCVFTGKSLCFLLCLFIITMFSPFKKTMRRGSSLKFIVLKKYQNNCDFAFPTKRNICNLLFLNVVSKWSHPWFLKANRNPADSLWNFTAAQHRLPFRQAGRQKGLGRNAVHMSKVPSLELPCRELGTQYYFDVLYSTLWVKRFREENPLAVCLLIQYVKCQPIHKQEEV